MYQSVYLQNISLVFWCSTKPQVMMKDGVCLQFWSGVLPLDVAKTHIQTATDLGTSRNPLHHLQLVSELFAATVI